MATSVEMLMRGLTTFARYLAPGVVVAFVVSLGTPCAAQVEVARYLHLRAGQS